MAVPARRPPPPRTSWSEWTWTILWGIVTGFALARGVACVLRGVLVGL